MLINASPLGKALLNGSSGGNVQSLAAGIYVVSSASAGLTNTEILGSSLSVSSLTIGGLAKTDLLGAFAPSQASSSGGLKNTIPLGSSVIVRTYGIGALYNTIPIASLAGTAAISNIISANTSVAYSVGASVSVSSSAAATANVSWVIAGQAQQAVFSAGYALVDYIVSGLGSVSTEATGDLPLTIRLTAGRPSNTVGESLLGGMILNSGESFLKARSIASGTALIVFAARAHISCQSYAIGALFDTIPLADLSSTGSVSNVISADVSLVKPIEGAAFSSNNVVADLLLIHELAGTVNVQCATSGYTFISKNLNSNLVVTTTTKPADTSVAYVIAAEAKTFASGFGDVNLVKPINGNTSAETTVSGNTSVHYVVSASVLTLVSVNANLAKTDNLQNLDGTGAISNVINAGLHLRKNLGFNALSLAAANGKALVVHAVDAEMATGSTATVFADSVYVDDISSAIFAEEIEISYISSQQEYWQMAA